MTSWPCKPDSGFPRRPEQTNGDRKRATNPFGNTVAGASGCLKRPTRQLGRQPSGGLRGRNQCLGGFLALPSGGVFGPSHSCHPKTLVRLRTFHPFLPTARVWRFLVSVALSREVQLRI